MNVYELVPTDRRKSFYGKAAVISTEEKEYLRSYNTIVASRDRAGNVFRHWGGWSATTGRHLIAFAGINKKAWDAMPVIPCGLF